MDLQLILKILLRRKWLILVSMLVPAIATFLFISQQDKSYKSDSLITTGVIGAGLNTRAENRSYVQDVMLTINFNQQIQTMQSKNMLRLVTYHMLINDLGGEEKPYREIEKEDWDEMLKPENNKNNIDYSQYNIDSLLATIKVKLDDLDTRALEREQEQLYKSLAKALEYDYKSLTQNLVIYRKGETDYIALEYTSEDPYLSAHLVNELTERFVKYNKFAQGKEYRDEYVYAREKAMEYKFNMDSMKMRLNTYMVDNEIVDEDAQSKEIVTSISKLEEERDLTAAIIPANKSAIEKLERSIIAQKQNKSGSKYGTLMDNEELESLNQQLKDLRGQLVEADDLAEEERIQSKIKLLRAEQDEYIQRTVQRESVEKESFGDRTLENLENEKLRKELALIDAEMKVKSLNESIAKLQGKRTRLAGDKGSLNRLQSDLEIAEDEYALAFSEMNKAKAVLDKAAQPIQIEEYAQVADKAESSNKAIFSAFAGVVGGAFSVMSLFLLAFLDVTLNSPNQFKKFADVELIGTLNQIKDSNADLKDVFSSNGKNEKLLHFKESIRNIRYEIEKSGANTFLFTSTKENQGKTFMMITLAYALTLKDKKVLLIDTNFKNNTLTQMSENAQRKNLLTTQLIGKANLDENFESKSGIGDKFSVDHVDIIGNRGGYNSPSEIFAGKNFKEFVKELAQSYDYIFLEGASLNTYSDARELTEYVDKVITIFAADTSIGEKDKNSIEFLNGLGKEKMMGAILNKLDVANLN